MFLCPPLRSLATLLRQLQRLDRQSAYTIYTLWLILYNCDHPGEVLGPRGKWKERLDQEGKGPLMKRNTFLNRLPSSWHGLSQSKVNSPLVFESSG